MNTQPFSTTMTTFSIWPKHIQSNTPSQFGLNSWIWKNYTDSTVPKCHKHDQTFQASHTSDNDMMIILIRQFETYLKNSNGVYDKNKQNMSNHLLSNVLKQQTEHPQSIPLSYVLALIYLYRGDTTSCLSVLTTILSHDSNFQQTRHMIKKYFQTSVLQMSLFFLFCFLCFEIKKADPLNNVLSIAYISLSILPKTICCPYRFLKTIADWEIEQGHSEWDNARTHYLMIVSHLNILSPKQDVMNTSFELQHNIDMNKPNTKHQCPLFCPNSLQSYFIFKTSDIVGLILKLSFLLTTTTTPIDFQLVQQLLQYAYVFYPNNVYVLSRLADLEYLDNTMLHGNNYYTSMLLKTLLFPSMISELCQLSPNNIIQTLECHLEFCHTVYPLVENDNKNDSVLLIELYMIMGRYYLSHSKAVEAKYIFMHALYLINCCYINEDPDIISSNTINPLNINIPLKMKRVLLQMMIMSCIYTKEFKEIYFYCQEWIRLYSKNIHIFIYLAKSAQELQQVKQTRFYLHQAIQFIQQTTDDLSTGHSTVLCFEQDHVICLYSLYFDASSFIWDINTHLPEHSTDIINCLTQPVSPTMIFLCRLFDLSRVQQDCFDTEYDVMRSLCGNDEYNYQLRYKFGTILFQQTHFKEAKDMLQECLTLCPTYIDASMLLATLYCVIHDYKQAYCLFQAIEPFQKMMTLDCLECYAISAKHCVPKKTDLLIQLWNSILQHAPNHLQALYELGILYFNSIKSLKKTEYWLKRLLNAYQHSATRLMSDTNQSPLTVSVALPVVAIDQDTNKQRIVDSCIILAQIALFQHCPTTVSYYLHQIFQFPQFHYTPYLILGQMHILEGHLFQAIQVFKSLIPNIHLMTRKEKVHIHNLLALCYDSLHIYTQAIYHAKKSQSYLPLCPMTLTIQSWSIIKRSLHNHHLDESIRLCTIAEQLEISSPFPKIFLGYFYILKNRQTKAMLLLHHAQRVLEYDMTCPIIDTIYSSHTLKFHCYLFLLLQIKLTLQSITHSNELSFYDLKHHLFLQKQPTSIEWTYWNSCLKLSPFVSNIFKKSSNMLNNYPRQHIFKMIYQEILHFGSRYIWCVHEHWKDITMIILKMVYWSSPTHLYLNDLQTYYSFITIPWSITTQHSRQYTNNQSNQTCCLSTRMPNSKNHSFSQYVHPIKKPNYLQDIVVPSETTLYTFTTTQLEIVHIGHTESLSSQIVCSTTAYQPLSVSFTRNILPTNKLQYGVCQIEHPLSFKQREFCLNSFNTTASCLFTLQPLNKASFTFLSSNDITIGECLATGGFGSVYNGYLSSCNVPIAIKKLHSTISALTRSQWKTILQEIQILALCHHPCLIQYLGIAVNSNHLCIITELCSKGSLFENLHHPIKKKHFPTTFKFRCQIALQIIDGIRYLHSKNLIHCDLKTLNIVLDHTWNAKICDFGLTRQIYNTSLKTSHFTHGSPRYMAPECYHSEDNNVTEKTDIWSIGCILIELFGGPIPYSHCHSIDTILKELLIDQHIPIIPNDFSFELKHMIQGCLQYESIKRWDIEHIYSSLLSLSQQDAE